jgi:brefeldin A-inhibited guanine nucleotide-exchange protein
MVTLYSFTELLQSSKLDNYKEILKPFEIACGSNSPEILSIAVDCLGKLFASNNWPFPDDGKQIADLGSDKGSTAPEEETGELVSFIIDTICNAFIGESTDESVQFQIIKALQTAIGCTEASHKLHGAILLKAIRTTYNIFLLSKSEDVQVVSQGAVQQMIQAIFARIPVPKKEQPVEKRFQHETPQLKDPPPAVLTAIKNDILQANQSASASEQSQEKQNEPSVSQEITLKYDLDLIDSFKVLRTLCILSVKAIPTPEG